MDLSQYLLLCVAPQRDSQVSRFAVRTRDALERVLPHTDTHTDTHMDTHTRTHTHTHNQQSKEKIASVE